MISIQTILDHIRDLPSLSSSMEQLAALVRDQRSSPADFERVIQADQALTENLLRISNSVWFGLRSRAETAHQAITKLGIKRVYEAASSAALARVIPSRLAGYEIDASVFWQHSAAVAILAERLSREVGTRSPDLIFTAALLHDIGKLVIGVFVSQESTAILDQVRARGLPFVSAERSILGVDHGEVGGEVALAWRLPDVAVWACRWHHQPDSAPPEVSRALIDLVHAADGLAHSLGFGADAGELARRISPEVEARLGLRTARLERVAGDSLEAIREMSDLLRWEGAP